MEMLLGLPPIDILISAEARISNYRFSISDEPEIRRLRDPFIQSNLSHQAIYRSSNADTMTSKYVFDRNFYVKYPCREDWIIGTVLEDATDATWFTDGSKTDQGTGFGIYRLETGEGIHGSVEHTPTVFQSEIKAIKICTETMINDDFNGRNIVIASDSKSSLQALSSFKIKSKQVWNCLQSFNELSTHNKVKLLWVPGHSDILGNEMADELANIGSSEMHEAGNYVCGASMGAVRLNSKNGFPNKLVITGTIYQIIDHQRSLYMVSVLV